MAHLSIQQAQAIVDDIRVTNGGFTPEIEKVLSKDALRAIRNLQSIAGGSIVHVAEDLYDKDTRFIFELIQNAEDNSYDHACSHGEKPFLSFTLHQDHITVDSNEDGFSEKDVRAICSIHQSTKKQTGGYIGHKGIGFKSVFKVAYKVLIQSGPFCFYLEHRQGDSGLGMITPFNQEPQDLPLGINTRITLFLLHDRDSERRADELGEIPDTLLLFLRKLERLTVKNLPLGSWITYKRHEDTVKRLVTLTQEIDGKEQKKFYHLEKDTLFSLPEHHNRPGQHEVDLILAFPVDGKFNPVIEAQYVYSFLPMRHEGFNFLIQSDFITQANRQGIHQCRRNLAIRDSISQLFVQAVHYFRKHSSLKYEWLQYLPGTHIHDPFWADLRDMIFDALKESKVLFSRKDILNYPKALQYLSSRHYDRHGQPLLADFEPEVYLSRSYKSATHGENLMELGVTNLSYKNILDRLAPYLEGPSPEFLNPSLDDDWHARLASLLLRALQQDGDRTPLTGRIKKMALIPTSNGTLSSAWSSEVYFPNDERGNIIPGDLEDIQIVQRSSLQSESRQLLFRALGVTHCEPKRVIKSILKKYNRMHGVTLQQSVSHLSYLFRTLEEEDVLDNRIFIFNKMRKPIYRAFVPFGAEIIKDDLYFETLGEYGTKELSQLLQSGLGQQNDSGFGLHIIDTSYIDAVPPGTVSKGRTWQQWLEEVASVRRTPRLRSARVDELSTLSQHLANHHPMRLIGLLKQHWDTYQVVLTPGVIRALKNMQVPCRNQSRQVLESTFFPSEELRQLCFDADVGGIFRYFLDIPTDLASTGPVGWEFLAKLGVDLRPNDFFFYSICLCVESEAGHQIVTQAAFFRIYRELSIRFPEPSGGLSQIFDELKVVCIPNSLEEIPKTTYLIDCVWNGHFSLRTKYPLGIHSEYSQDPHVAFLFQKILRVPDAGLDTYLEELQWYKANSDVAQEDLKVLYDNIAQNIQQPGDFVLVLDRFIEHKLVYLPGEQVWLSPESCVWADAPKIGAQHGIRTVYLELQDFFRKSLKVQTPTAADYIEQLRKLVSKEIVDISDIKAAINNLEILGPSSDELKVLSGMRFLPVKMPSGDVEVLKPTDTFFLADRVEYLAAFRGKVPILDFSLEECRRMYRLIRDVGLEDRYMSIVVEEQTVVRQPSDEPSSSETLAFHQKARYIYRCILHYKSEGREIDERVLHQLQNSVVYESSGFEKSLVLQSNEVTARVQSDKGSVHIEEVSDVLHIYIPRNPGDRRRCYSVSLPQALRRHFGLKDSEASFALKLVFVTPESDIDESLDDNGIIQIIADISQPESESGNSPSSESHAEEDSTAGEVNALSGFEETQEIGQGIETPISSIEVIVEVPQTLVIHHRSSPPASQPFRVPRFVRASPDSAPVPYPLQAPYIQLLDKVIQLARLFKFSEISQSWKNYVWGSETVLHKSVFGDRSENQSAHDCKIGAAGELFVFELLLAQWLPDFDRSNWRSNIRAHVSVHPNYHDLTPWKGVETADLVYRDSSSVLTTLLINAGYLPHTRWHDETPTYYIEVKTTIGERDTSFFMSKSQYKRMQRMRIDPDKQTEPEIYVIFRVYHLGKSSMGLEIHVDPESLRQRQRLIFTPESYSVCPSVI